MSRRDTAKEEADLKYDLREVCKRLLNVLTPSTERFGAIETTIRRILQVLDNYQEETTLAVVGPPGSGKSTLINSLIGMRVIPTGNSRALPIVPFVSETPMLRLGSGKAVACGEEGCYDHLKSEEALWIDALGDRRLHAPLPVIKGPHCFRNKWVAVDSAMNASCVLQKLSLIATRVATPTYFAGAQMLYCVDATKLGTPQESTVLDLILGSADPVDVSIEGMQRLFTRTIFVLTHADYVFEIEDDIAHVLQSDTTDKTPIRSISDLVQHFLTLVEARFPGISIEKRQIVPFSGRNALLTKRILMFEPDIQELYDYCETVFGASFMQSVDNLELDYLKRHVQHFALNTMLNKSGAKALTEVARLFDFNAGRHLLCDNCCLALDSVQQLDRALESAKPFVEREVTDYRTELECLVKETAWVLDSSEIISAYAKKMVDDVAEVAVRSLKQFFQERLHDLRYVLEGRPLVWFSERQACTIMDMKSTLNKVQQFTETYILQRGFLEKKIQDKRQSAGGFDFIDTNSEALLAAMENEKKEHLVTFCTSVSHHIKDEFTRFLPTLVELAQAKQDEVTREYLDKIRSPVTETENRIREQLDIDRLSELLRTSTLVEENDRRVKNFLRELPDHVAVAAVEISNQWYVPLSDEELTHPKLPSKREEFEKRLKAATAKQGDDVDETQFKMPSDLLYVLEAWRLSFGLIQLHQLCTYNVHSFTSTVNQVNERVLDFVHRLVVSLEEGAIAQKEDVDESERVVAEIDDVRSKLSEIQTHLQRLLAVIEEGMVVDLEEAVQLSCEDI